MPRRQQTTRDTTDLGEVLLAVRKDTGEDLAGADGKYGPLQTDASGNLRVVGGTGSSSDQVQGNVAHDAADAGNPLKIGGKASTSEPAAVANGDRVNAYFDENGYQRVKAGATENHLGKVGGNAATPSANFTRPADTTAYASGDLVANSTTAGSVTPLSFTAARVAAGSGIVLRARLKKSTTSLTNASFRIHLYGASPTVTNGDNGAWVSTQSSYLGSFDITVDKAFSDAAEGVGTPVNGTEILFALASGTTVYGLIEARAAYTPGNSEVFTCELEIIQN